MKVTVSDFAESFGTTAENIPGECLELIEKGDFEYEILKGKERDTILLDVLNKIETDKQIIGAEEREEVWFNGWDENLQSFINSGNSF